MTPPFLDKQAEMTIPNPTAIFLIRTENVDTARGRLSTPHRRVWRQKQDAVTHRSSSHVHALNVCRVN
ncbi:hypothetical protein M404DRAFT_998322 [Pisolithus tinctorius Marx 270]|uniref:Uncharacterized protein n=1 Tax=Pisolithus tinctorius Marx 270 TaxID=870435 RepID=A0A0C3PG30_PISTI|nr:hypothetical protein M404DRAFT_998322 [Pisolithus tinctorius Marx 270]